MTGMGLGEERRRVQKGAVLIDENLWSQIERCMCLMDAVSTSIVEGHSEHLCFPGKRFLKKSRVHVSKLVRPWRQDKFGGWRNGSERGVCGER